MPNIKHSFGIAQIWDVVYEEKGIEKWRIHEVNLVPNQMLNSILNGIGYVNIPYIGLVNNAGFSAYAGIAD